VISGLSRRLLRLVGLGLPIALASPLLLEVLAAGSLPQVQLSAGSIEPRPIEELTGTNVARDYAYAWRDLAQALDHNQADRLDAYFTGFAKDTFTQRISDQKTADVHVLYVDHGHKVKAFFYSPDGGEMQLLDKAQLEIQVYAGGKLIHQENAAQDYLVLMTPGADRWFVRSLEPIAGSSF